MKTKRLIIYAVYLAIILFMALTPQVGFIYAGPIKISTMMIPIVICSVHLGWRGAIFSSTTFGFLSFILGISLYPSVVYSGWLSGDVGLWFVTSFVSRFLMGLLLALIMWWVEKLKPKILTDKKDLKFTFLKMAIAAVFGQLLNTFLFLGFAIWFGNKGFNLIIVLLTSNLIVEWIIVLIIPTTLTPLVNYLQTKYKEEDKW